jgi:uncharacterized protein YpmB
MTRGVVLADGGNVGTGGLIAIAIVFIVFAAIAVSVTSYFRLQRHRADAVAYAAYRKLAEEAVERQDQVMVEIKTLDMKVSEIEHLLRSVE